MVTINLPRCRVIIGALGFGSFITKKDSFRILEKAAELGFNEIDCGISYGNGEARKIISEFILTSGVDFHIWEKFGLQMKMNNSGGLTAATGFGSLSQLQSSLAEMLRIYNSKIYNLQIHTPVPLHSIDSVMNFLHEAHANGSIENIGVSNHEAPDLMEIYNLFSAEGLSINSNQVHLNFAERKALELMLPLSNRLEIPIFANRALARGLLAHANVGQSNRVRVSQKTKSHHENYADYYRIMQQTLTSVTGRPAASAAISWLAGHPGISGIILGVSSVHQLIEAHEAVLRPFPTGELSSLSKQISPQMAEIMLKLPRNLFDLTY